jgi:hypothetical protein
MYDNEYNRLIASTKVKSHPIFLERMKEEYFFGNTLYFIMD